MTKDKKLSDYSSQEQTDKGHFGEDAAPTDTVSDVETQRPSPTLPKEIGGPKGPEPTRYGDWEKNGIISDF